MDIPGAPAIADSSDTAEDAPWGVNPATGKPYTISPEERAERGKRLADARRAKAAAAVDEAPRPPEQLEPIDRTGRDREPGTGRRRRRGSPAGAKTKPDAEVPPFRAGPIAKGTNRLYAKAGKIVRLVNPGLGEAIIACTRKESDDDLTVGEAWEELAKVNPKVRGVLLKLVTGGAWGQVFWAHAPILLAFLMLEPVRRRLPFPDLVDAVLSDEGTAPPAGAGGGQPFVDPQTFSGADLADMMAAAQQMFGEVLSARTAGAQLRMPTEADTEQQPVDELAEQAA